MPAKPIEVNIQTKVDGLAQIKALENALQRLKSSFQGANAIQERVAGQYRVDTAIMRQNNQVLRARTQLSDKDIAARAVQMNFEEDYQLQIQRRMQIERQAFRIRQLALDARMKMTLADARVNAEANMEIIASEQAKAAQLRITQQALMRASISMFVMNISMGQLVTAMKPFVKGNEDAEKALENLSGALQFSMAPLQAYMSLQMISISLAHEQKVAFLGVAASLASIFFLYTAITSKSAGMRAAFAALTVVSVALAIAQWAIATGLATTETLLGNIVAIGVIVAGLAALGAAIGFITAPHAQTEPGQRRRIDKAGLAVVHEGEIWRPTGSDDGGDGTKSVTIYLPPGYRGSVGESKMFAKEIDRLINAGQSSTNYRKAVVSSG